MNQKGYCSHSLATAIKKEVFNNFLESIREKTISEIATKNIATRQWFRSKNHWNKWSIAGGKDGNHQINNSHLRSKLIITSMRLPRGDNVRCLSHRCSTLGCSCCSTTSSCTFTSQNAKKKERPAAFKPFPQIRESFDSTKFRFQSSKNNARQGNSYSNYKHHKWNASSL